MGHLSHLFQISWSRPVLMQRANRMSFSLLLHTCLAAWITKDKERTNEHIIIIIDPLTMRVGGAPRMISQPVSSIFPCFSLPSVTWRSLGLSIPWCRLPTSSSVCLVFLPLSLCLAKWFWSDLMNGRHDHTTAVCFSLRSSGLRVVRFYLLDLGTDFLVGNMVFVWDA